MSIGKQFLQDESSNEELEEDVDMISEVDSDEERA